MVGKKVQQFYNKMPFPDYELDRFNLKEDLEIYAYPFAKILDRSIPDDASIIDVGTGTGQLSAFLSLRRKCVWGIDFSDTSLNKARSLKDKLKLDTLYLEKVDILDNKQIDSLGKRFDYILCLGVLHHTENPYQGFKNILRLTKPNGYVAIGLYNKFGRMPLKVRKFFAKTIFRDNDQVKDWFIRMQIWDIEDKERAKGWWNDQYLHPHETAHTLGEILRWFKENNIDYYQAAPSLIPFNKDILDITGVWNNYNEVYPNLFIRFYKQLTWIWKTHHEGGYWITFGRVKNV